MLRCRSLNSRRMKAEYDVSDILANARSSQGVINPQATDDSELLSALQEKESKKNKVGLGNQGIF